MRSDDEVIDGTLDRSRHPHQCVRVKLAPGEPERLVRGQLVAVAVARPEPASVEREHHAADLDRNTSCQPRARSGGRERDCVARGSRMRIMPIALTTLTTVGGLIPLAMAGGPLFEPLAVVIIFGLLLSTVLTLVVVPAIYCIFIETFRVNVFPNKDLKEVTKAHDEAGH